MNERKEIINLVILQRLSRILSTGHGSVDSETGKDRDFLDLRYALSYLCSLLKFREYDYHYYSLPLRDGSEIDFSGCSWACPLRPPLIAATAAAVNSGGRLDGMPRNRAASVSFQLKPLRMHGNGSTHEL
jgi:hypothetical protein